jgi:heat shock protein HslJ
MKIAGIVLFFCIAILFSCSPTLSPDNNWAEGRWILTELKEVPVQMSGNNNRNAHLEFKPSAKSYNGFGGCNNIAGTYTISKSKINFSQPAAKLAGCPDAPFETTFLSLLDEVDKYEVNGNTLTLKKGSKAMIKLERK